MNKSVFLKSALALALAAPLLASADSQVVVGAGPSAVANLNFQVVIPRVLLLQVGNISTVDLVDFNLSAPAVQPGLGGAGVGRTNGTVVPVRVLGNNGVITIASVGSAGGLTSGGNSIPWSQVTTSSSDATNFASPAPGGASVTVARNTGSTLVTNRTADWTFNYANTTVVPAGTYTGSVVYTATMP
jgi:hypothetical protein